MKIDMQSIGKAFTAKVMDRAVKAFDRATMVVVASCWAGAIAVMALALYTVSLSVKAKQESIAAASIEPGLPKVVSKPLETAEIQPIVDRLQKRFPEITFTATKDKTVSVTASDVNYFRLWLTVLSYIDTVTPQYRWTLKEFCVGIKCDKNTPMKAVLGAEKVTFATPSAGK